MFFFPLVVSLEWMHLICRFVSKHRMCFFSLSVLDFFAVRSYTGYINHHQRRYFERYVKSCGCALWSNTTLTSKFNSIRNNQNYFSVFAMYSFNSKNCHCVCQLMIGCLERGGGWLVGGGSTRMFIHAFVRISLQHSSVNINHQPKFNHRLLFHCLLLLLWPVKSSVLSSLADL